MWRARKAHRRLSDVGSMSTITLAQHVSEQPKEHAISSVAFESLVISFVLSEAALWMAVWNNWIWLAVLLVLVTAHVMHGLLIGLHEAVHGLLRKNRRLNEFDGLLIGVFSWLPLTLYRVVHQSHHVHLATERDAELWPFVRPTAPRWARHCASVLELSVGLIYSPLLFLRIFFQSDSPIRSPKVRRRIWAELALGAAVWAAIFALVAFWGVWKYWYWMYLAPAVIAANLQSWRKYIEHIGLTGNTANSSTRSIVPKSWLGRLFAYTLLHEPYHGVHHQHAGLPHSALPRFTSLLVPKNPGERVPFMSYRQALPDLLRSLANPRVGAQWCNSPRN
jgi:fatty acid desaturase